MPSVTEFARMSSRFLDDHRESVHVNEEIYTMNPFQEWVRRKRAGSFSAAGRMPSAGRRWLRSGRRLDRLAPAAERAKRRIISRDFAPKAKHVIYLHMVGGPPQMDLYDYKPKMKDYFDKDLPDSVRKGQRLTTHDLRPGAVSDRPVEIQIRATWQKRHVGHASCCRTRPRWSTTCASSAACTPKPSTTSRPSRSCKPATRSPAGPASAPGPPTASARSTTDLPTFVVLVAKPTNTEQIQAISARLWSRGYLPSDYAGVSFRSAGDPILYINNPAGVSTEVRRQTLDGLQTAQRDELSSSSAIRKPTPASSNTNWRSACKRACPS